MSLSAQHISIGYKEPLLSGLSIDLPQSGLVSLVGRNGSGKSTLLRSLAGLIPTIAGEVMLDGASIQSLSATQRARQISFVPSKVDESLVMTVRDFVSLGRLPYVGLLRRFDGLDEEIIDAALHQFEIGHFSNRLLTELSDGERQRVSLAKAFVQQTPIILLDEPTSFLDVSARVSILRLLKEIGKKALVVFSTHDITLAGQLSDQMLLLKDGHVLLDKPQSFLASKKLDSIFEEEGVHIAGPDFRIVIE